MGISFSPFRMLTEEARALLTRLNRIRPPSLVMPMVPAAGMTPTVLSAIEQHLHNERTKMREMVLRFLRWLNSSYAQCGSPSQAQKIFALLKIRFNAVLTNMDIFFDAVTQRSEHENGVWLAGLDVFAEDALSLSGYYETPPVLCYLDRGHGAAIRRARTRLPGGGKNPVAIIRIPRERMVGCGIASSLVHEAGHQASALLGLTDSIRPILKGMQMSGSTTRTVWHFWERWISEIIPDFWAVAKLGIIAALGLIGVVSLPRTFVLRLKLDDPHPCPWIRVKLCCAMGNALYPHSQWRKLAQLWETFYPLNNLSSRTLKLLRAIEASMESFVTLLVNHRPRRFRGNSLLEVMAFENLKPSRLSDSYQQWRSSPHLIRDVPPCHAFAIVGQAKAEAKLSPLEESRTIANLITHWALHSRLNISAMCAALPGVRAAALTV